MNVAIETVITSTIYEPSRYLRVFIDVWCACAPIVREEGFASWRPQTEP
jgi:hypothetical protein